ncbi:MAG: GatB/YqeY domain-containing protein [Patescibacteria group bacterium]|nr:GatB/YqeY domain-containing protein [Patescibacteria group bacterium]
MSLHQKIKEGIKESMKNRDTVQLNVRRDLVTSFTNELVANGKTPQGELTDEEVLKVITRTAKQRKDSIDQFTKGGRNDLVEEEKAQLAILEKYLPEMMNEDDIRKVVEAKLLEMGSGNKGMLMGSIMKELKGKADGSLVKKVLNELI